MENYAEITGLLFKHLRSELTQEESAVIDAWVAQSEQNRQFFDYINNTQSLLEDVRAIEEAQEIDEEKAWNRLKEQAWEKPLKSQLKLVTKTKRWVTIAAVVIGLATLIPFSLLWFVHPGKPANLPGAHYNLPGDVTPGSNKAYLNLDDGRRIILDNTNNGELAQQGSMQIDRKDGQVSYAGYNGAGTSADLYNQVTVPNGDDVVALELADGSKVWLNAGSTFSYPVSFDKGERIVEITGEAYFEVAGTSNGKVTPFVVSKGDLMVEVLGTKFNVNTYNNEDVIKVTLLDGSAKVQYRQSGSIIKAGGTSHS